MKTKLTFRAVCALLLCTMLLLPCAGVLVQAAADDSIAPKEATIAHSLPYSTALAFAHEGSANGEVTNDIKCKKLSIVTVSAIGEDEGDRVELRAYTDTGTLIASSSAEPGERCILQFMPSYTGSYRIKTQCRNTTAEISEVSLYVGEFTKYKTNEAGEYPISASHSSRTHDHFKASALLPPRAKEADWWNVSVFSFPHGARDVLSYRVTTTGDMTVHTVLFTYEDGIYRTRSSYEIQSHEAADAQKLPLEEDAYLLVYSQGEFTLEADLLKHHESTPDSISPPWSGKLDMTGGEKCYDETEYAALIENFPFCNVKNTYEKRFLIETDASSAVSLICERREHSFFSVVNDADSSPARSIPTLRDYSSYCSETEPTKYCLESFICDSGKTYLVYSGSSLNAYVDIDAAPVCSGELNYESEYHKNTPIPSPEIGAFFSDSALFSKIGAAPHESESAETIGYVIESEDGTRYYYGFGDTILPPEKKGECRMYCAVRRICVRNGWGEVQTHLVPICSFKTTGVLFFPMMEEIFNDIEKNGPLSVIYMVFILITIASLVGAAVYQVIRKKKQKKQAATDPSEPEQSPKESGNTNTDENEKDQEEKDDDQAV